jgi:hypothetical protein
MSKRFRRHTAIKQPSSAPLFVLAGLPMATFGGAKRLIETNFGKRCSVQGLPAKSSDGNIYDKKHIEQLVALAAEFSRRRRIGTAPIPVTPNFVYLLYVPSRDDSTLLREFDFAVFPIALSALGRWSERGRMLRHDAGAVASAVSASVKDLDETAKGATDRIKLSRATDVLLLPPNNFHLGENENLSKIFMDFRCGRRSWIDRVEELAPEEYNSGTLEPLHGKEVQRCFKDIRQIVFFRPPVSEYHGTQREVDEVVSSTGGNILRALYRFGVPLPQGFQHDAQFEGGRTFKSQEFECCEKGRVWVTATHANIYPNDFVRAKGLTRKNEEAAHLEI